MYCREHSRIEREKESNISVAGVGPLKKGKQQKNGRQGGDVPAIPKASGGSRLTAGKSTRSKAARLRGTLGGVGMGAARVILLTGLGREAQAEAKRALAALMDCDGPGTASAAITTEFTPEGFFTV